MITAALCTILLSILALRVLSCFRAFACLLRSRRALVLRLPLASDKVVRAHSTREPEEHCPTHGGIVIVRHGPRILPSDRVGWVAIVDRSKSFMNGSFKSEAGADGCRWYDVVTERRDQDGLCKLRREEVWKR